MGFYINPPNMTKEEWLRRNGEMIDPVTAQSHSVGERVVVCLVDNGLFTAAGIAYDDKERDDFCRPDIGVQRRRQFYLVPRDVVKEYCDILCYTGE